MTNLHFTAEFIAILNDLLEVGITCCNVHEARLQLDYLFDSFEECEGVLEELADADQQLESKNMEAKMINDCLYQIETVEAQIPEDLKQQFYIIGNLDEREVDCDGF